MKFCFLWSTGSLRLSDLNEPVVNAGWPDGWHLLSQRNRELAIAIQQLAKQWGVTPELVFKLSASNLATSGTEGISQSTKNAQVVRDKPTLTKEEEKRQQRREEAQQRKAAQDSLRNFEKLVKNEPGLKLEKEFVTNLKRLAEHGYSIHIDPSRRVTITNHEDRQIFIPSLDFLKSPEDRNRFNNAKDALNNSLAPLLASC